MMLMGRPLSLRPRLMAVTQWIAPHDRVADIGTDHARLPVYLMQRGLAAVAYGLDIAPGPLARARRTVETHHLQDKVTLLLSNGAEALSPEQVDTVVITGMGGETIRDILGNAPWLRTKRLILGPHTHKDELPQWLRAMGFHVQAQQDIPDAGRVYRLYCVEGECPMTTVSELLHTLSQWAPPETAMEKDTVGLLAGRHTAPVSKVMLSLDITAAVIDEAYAKGCQLIAAHHPIVRKTVPYRVTDTDIHGGALVLSLCEKQIAAICMHTNLDAAAGGVNDILADTLGLAQTRTVLDSDTGIGRCAPLDSPLSVPDFAALCKQKLGCGVVRYHDAGRPVAHAAVCGGSGGSCLTQAAKAGCDTLVTADIGHHDFLLAADLGLNCLDCGHFATENVVIAAMVRRLKMPGLILCRSETNKEPYQCL